jgi:hypothetical protein
MTTSKLSLIIALVAGLAHLESATASIEASSTLVITKAEVRNSSGNLVAIDPATFYNQYTATQTVVKATLDASSEFSKLVDFQTNFSRISVRPLQTESPVLASYDMGARASAQGLPGSVTSYAWSNVEDSSVNGFASQTYQFYLAPGSTFTFEGWFSSTARSIGQSDIYYTQGAYAGAAVVFQATQQLELYSISAYADPTTPEQSKYLSFATEATNTYASPIPVYLSWSTSVQGSNAIAGSVPESPIGVLMAAGLLCLLGFAPGRRFRR